MNFRINRSWPALTLFALMLVFTSAARAATIYAINSTSSLLTFDSATPGALLSNVGITGVGAGESLLGIDFRPANGSLYALSADAGNIGRLYTINTTTGAATLASTLSTPLGGANGFGMDFNPVPDRLRIVNSSGQNLRVNVDTGAVTTDTNLAYAVGDSKFGINPSVSAAAYSNNFAGSVVTTLYDLDIELKLLAIQTPPNGGVLNTVGALGVTPNSIERAGLDILTDSGGTNTAFAMLSTQTSPNGFYTINLATGAATFVGDIGAVLRSPIQDIAAAPLPPGGGGPGTPLPPALLLAIPGAAFAAIRARRWNRGK